MDSDLEVLPSVESLTKRAAQHFVALAAAAIDDHGRFAVALSGGTTPKQLYACLAAPEWLACVLWPQVDVFWGDERCVPPAHPASNYRTAREALLEHVAVDPERVHRIHGEDEPDAAASAYEHELRAAFATPAGPPRLDSGARFDHVLLGMGDDGHTASLFPHSPALHETARWAIAGAAKAEPRRRVTLTLPVLNAAADVTFLVAGRVKAPALARVLEGRRDPDDLPAQLIAPQNGHLHWLVDADAASQLRRR